MKKRLLYVAFTLLTVLGFASTAQAQNAYAYGLNGALSTDGTTINVNYRLNAAATGANIILTNGDKEVLSLPVEAANLVAGEHSIAIPVTNLPTGVDLKWKIEVKSAIAATPTVLPKAYRFYHPQGVVVDNNPNSANFGRILVTECMTVKDVIYQSGNAADGQGIYAFDPTMTPIKNKNGGFAFKGGMTYSETFTGLTKTSYDPRKIRITEDGRIFVTRQSNVDTPLMEVNPLDLDAPFVSVFQGTVDAATLETKDADGKFIASANVGFDVMGSGANLKLLMLSTNADGLGFSQSGFRTDEYNLGTAKTFSTVPTKSIVELSGQKTISYANASVQYDKEGGIWYVQYRGTPTHAEPAIIHINALGEEDYRDITTVAGGGGVCFNPDFTLIAITNKKKWVGIYEIGKDAAQKPTLTLKYEFDTTIGNNCNDIAWDVANNLYVVGNSGEWFKAFALPRATDAVTTPAMDKFAINIPAPVPPTPAGPALTEKWKITEGLPVAAEARQAAYKNGKLYIQNKATKTIQVWDAKGLTDEGYPSGAGTNITTDEAGNIIVRIGTFPNAFASDVAELRIISADGKITKDVTLSGIPAGRCDFFGKVKGNVLDAVDGGVLYLMIGGNQSITVVPIIDGVQNIDYTFQAPYDGALATSGVINAVGEKLVVYGRGGGNTIVEGAMEGEAFVKNRTYITPSHNAANGCTSFTMGGVEYILYTTSPNAKYGDGFAIAKASDVADNAIIVENVETINAKNGFQANWVFAEVVSDTKANIYQYFPGGYIAMYEFTIPAPEPPVVTALTQKWKITEGLPAAPEARQAAYKNGKLYIQNKATKTIQVWDAKGLTDEGYPSGAGTNITTDEAGNIIVRIGTFPNAFASDVAELRIISADGKITKDVTLSGIPAGRCDFFGKVKGNVLDAVDGGVLYLMIGGNQSITVVPIIDGVQNIDYTFQAPYDGALATSGVINAVGEKLVVYGRGGGNTIVEGAMEGEAFVKNRTYITPSHNAANGCTSFTMGGVEYILYTTSPNAKYGDGFAIAKASDVADNAIIVENVETINAKNGFQANWVFAEVVSDTKANIYQYFPGGYIAMYEFTTPAPEKADLYMIGQIAPNNYEWKANVGHKMDGGVDGIYTTTVRIAENATSDGIPAFGFATKLGANADDWATLNANRFGAAVDGTMVDNDTEAPLVKAEGALKIKGWEYLVTVNMKAMTVKCTATTPIPSETYPETLYVIGQIKPAEGDQWKTDDASYPLAKTGNEGEYKGTDIKLYGNAFFTLVSKLGATWDIVNPFRYGPAIADDVLVPEVAATVTVGATNSWKIIPAGYTLLVNLKNKTILASKTSGVDGVDAAAVKVIGGVGEINVIGEANSIEVFNAGGALVSKNETSVLCASGIYFVRVDGKITKVVVR
ncbi:MAG: hypothetical protein RSA66_02325 [Muribaculaceae bacterium]